MCGPELGQRVSRLHSLLAGEVFMYQQNQGTRSTCCKMWPLEGRSPSGGWERIAVHHTCQHSPHASAGLDIQLIAQTFIYYSIVIFGLLVAIPVGITTKKFGGWCILYGDVTDDKLTFGASVYCHYVTYVNVLISVIYGGVLAVSHTVAVVRNVQGSTQLSGVRSPIWSIVLLGCNTIVTLLSLGSACILTVGFQRWCSSLLSNARLHHGYHLHSCSEAEHLEWENVDGSTFYACYSIATASAWLSLFAWLIQTSLNLLVFIRLKKDEFGLSALDSADNSPVHEPALPRSTSPERY